MQTSADLKLDVRALELWWNVPPPPLTSLSVDCKKPRWLLHSAVLLGGGGRGSYRIFCWRGGGPFLEIVKVEKNSCPEIESGGFWQLADYPTLVFKIIVFLNLVIVNWNRYHSCKVIKTSKFWGGIPVHPPLCMKPWWGGQDGDSRP